MCGQNVGKAIFTYCQSLNLPCCKISHKPSSVLSNHLSRLIVANKLKRHTQRRDGQPLYASLFGLAPSGVYIAVKSPSRWWALTSPFHPYLYNRRYISVALSFKSPWLDVIQHPALRSSDFPLLDLV